MATSQTSPSSFQPGQQLLLSLLCLGVACDVLQCRLQPLARGVGGGIVEGSPGAECLLETFSSLS